MGAGRIKNIKAVKSELPNAAATDAIGVRGHRVRDVAKAESRRREILDGAARAFARGGYDATNMDQIAAACGLAKGHIYHYFRSKEEIFNEVRTDAMRQAIAQIEAIVQDPAGAPELLLRDAIAAVVARVLREGGRYEQMLTTPISLGPENLTLLRNLSRRFEQLFSGVLKLGIEDGSFVPGDPKLMAFVILRGAVTVAGWYREGGRWKPQWIVEQVTEQLLRSVRKPRTGNRTNPAGLR